MKKEPDDTPLRREHVRTFLSWYASRTPLDRFPGVEEMWWNALHTLNLGELRNGMRAYSRFQSKLAVSPPQFWHICKGTTSEKQLLRIRKLHEQIRQGKIKTAPGYTPQRRVDEDAKPGASHD